MSGCNCTPDGISKSKEDLFRGGVGCHTGSPPKEAVHNLKMPENSWGECVFKNGIKPVYMGMRH